MPTEVPTVDTPRLYLCFVSTSDDAKITRRCCWRNVEHNNFTGNEEFMFLYCLIVPRMLECSFWLGSIWIDCCWIFIIFCFCFFHSAADFLITLNFWVFLLLNENIFCKQREVLAVLVLSISCFLTNLRTNEWVKKCTKLHVTFKVVRKGRLRRKFSFAAKFSRF